MRFNRFFAIGFTFCILPFQLVLPATSNAQTESRTLWQYYTEVLRAAIKMEAKIDDSSDQIHFFSTPRPADWDESQFGLWRFLELADTIPKWGDPVYSGTGRKFSDAYIEFLCTIPFKLNDDKEQKRAELSAQRMIEAIEQINIARVRVQEVWKQFDATQNDHVDKVSYNTWYQNTGSLLESRAKLQLNSRISDYNYWLGKVVGSMSNVITEFYNDAYKVKVRAKAESSEEFRPDYSSSSELSKFITASKSLNNDSCDKLKITIDKNNFDSKSSSEQGGINSVASINLLSTIQGEGKEDTVELEVNNETFNLQFCVRNWQSFSISPGKWYNGNIVRKFGSNYKSTNISYEQQKFFGKNGILNLRPVQIIVVYQPKLAITLTKSKYDLLREKINKSAGVKLGFLKYKLGLSGDASKDKDITTVSFNQETKTIYLEDKTEVPQILAVVSAELP
jgi:hypothetical protein